jgi:phage gp36-like protein
MIYVTKDDLIAQSFERFIDESSLDNAEVIDKAELRNIELIKSYIGSRYNVAMIFDSQNPIKNEVLAGALVTMMLFDIIRRNSARKVPTDYREDYDKAVELIQKISTGKILLSDLPKAVDDSGQEVKNSIWGNNSNKNFYI